MRSPKWLGGGVNFQFNGIIVVFLVEALLHLELRPLSRLAEHNIMGSGSQLCASGPLGVTVNGSPTTISTPWFLDLWSLAMGETAPYIGWRIRIYTASRRTLPKPCKELPPSWCCKWVYKRPSPRGPSHAYIQVALVKFIWLKSGDWLRGCDLPVGLFVFFKFCSLDLEFFWLYRSSKNLTGFLCMTLLETSWSISKHHRSLNSRLFQLSL